MLQKWNSLYTERITAHWQWWIDVGVLSSGLLLQSDPSEYAWWYFIKKTRHFITRIPLFPRRSFHTLLPYRILFYCSTFSCFKIVLNYTVILQKCLKPRSHLPAVAVRFFGLRFSVRFWGVAGRSQAAMSALTFVRFIVRFMVGVGISRVRQSHKLHARTSCGHRTDPMRYLW